MRRVRRRRILLGVTGAQAWEGWPTLREPAPTGLLPGAEAWFSPESVVPPGESWGLPPYIRYPASHRETFEEAYDLGVEDADRARLEAQRDVIKDELRDEIRDEVGEEMTDEARAVVIEEIRTGNYFGDHDLRHAIEAIEEAASNSAIDNYEPDCSEMCPVDCADYESAGCEPDCDNAVEEAKEEARAEVKDWVADAQIKRKYLVAALRRATGEAATYNLRQLEEHMALFPPEFVRAIPALRRIEKELPMYAKRVEAHTQHRGRMRVRAGELARRKMRFIDDDPLLGGLGLVAQKKESKRPGPPSHAQEMTRWTETMREIAAARQIYAWGDESLDKFVRLRQAFGKMRAHAVAAGLPAGQDPSLGVFREILARLPVPLYAQDTRPVRKALARAWVATRRDHGCGDAFKALREAYRALGQLRCMGGAPGPWIRRFRQYSDEIVGRCQQRSSGARYCPTTRFTPREQTPTHLPSMEILEIEGSCR